MMRVHYGTDADESVGALLDGHLPRLDATSTVVIKPNIVVAKKKWLGADTRPEVVEAIISRLRDLGVKDITVADGSGVGHSASRAFSILGYDRLARRNGFKLLDVEKDCFVRRPTKIDGPFSSLEISQTVAEADFLINVPVLKAHGETRVTCSLKNMKGLMPKGMKPRFHSVDLERAIAQLNTVIEADLILVDGAYGDLSSEMGGNPMEMGIMVCGVDPLEIDIFASRTLGFEPRRIGHIAHYAGFRGVDISGFRPDLYELNSPEEEKSFQAETDPFSRFPCKVTDEGVCCTCRGNLVFALKRLSERSLLAEDQHFLIGKRGEVPHAPPGKSAAGKGNNAEGNEKNGTKIVAVGDCAVRRLRASLSSGADAELTEISGCPPETMQIVGKFSKNIDETRRWKC